MKLGRFEAILDAYGAAPERWPDRDRAAALEFAHSSVSAARALAQARALDEALQAIEISEIAIEPVGLSHLHTRIVAAARPLSKRRIFEWFGLELTPAQLWPSAAGLAVAGLLGFIVGVGGLIPGDSGRDFEDATVMPSADLTTPG